MKWNLTLVNLVLLIRKSSVVLNGFRVVERALEKSCFIVFATRFRLRKLLGEPVADTGLKSNLPLINTDKTDNRDITIISEKTKNLINY